MNFKHGKLFPGGQICKGLTLKKGASVNKVLKFTRNVLQLLLLVSAIITVVRRIR